MRTAFLLASLLSTGAALGAAPAVATVWDSGSGGLVQVAANRLIVGWHPAAEGAVGFALSATPLMTTAAGVRMEIVTLAPGESLLARQAEILSMPGVAWVALDHLNTLFATPSDPVFADQWNLAAIFAAAAWDTETGGPAPLVAVLDSGFDLAHPDITFATAPGANLDYGSIPNDADPTWDTFNPGQGNCATS
ncbi:hypothetical protein IIA16_04540, partial [bacterium]|nr:hypothetical protein [bacterium]